MNKFICAALLLLPLVSAPAYAEAVSVHGSTVFTASLLDANKDTIETETGLTLNIEGSSAGAGVEDVAAGKADVGMITGKLDDLVAKINAKTPGAVDLSKLTASEVGQTRVVFAAHPSANVKELTRDQITKILKGEVTNWKDVGGADMPIALVTGIAATGLRSAVEKDFLDGASISEKARTLAKSSLIAAVVEKIPGALGIISSHMLTPAMTEIKLDKAPADIKLSYVTKGAPSAAAKKLIDATVKIANK